MSTLRHRPMQRTLHRQDVVSWVPTDSAPHWDDTEESQADSPPAQPWQRREQLVLIGFNDEAEGADLDLVHQFT